MRNGRTAGRGRHQSGSGVIALAFIILALAWFGVALAAEPERLNDGEDCAAEHSDLDVNIDACTRVIENPETGVERRRAAFFNRGNLKTGKGFLDSAIDDFSQAIALQPADPISYFARGRAYAARGKPDEAIDDFNRAIAIDPDYIEAYAHRGGRWFSKGVFLAAIMDYGMVISRDPDNVSAYYIRAKAKDEYGDTDGAIADYTQVVALDDTNVDTYAVLGRLRYFRGDFAGAHADFEQSLDSSASDYDALWLELAVLQLGRPSWLAEVRDSVKESSVWTGCLLDFVMGRHTHAEMTAFINAYGDVNTTRLQTCELSFYAGEMHRLAGELAEAADLHRQAVKICPKTSTMERLGSRDALKAMGVN